MFLEFKCRHLFRLLIGEDFLLSFADGLILSFFLAVVAGARGVVSLFGKAVVTSALLLMKVHILILDEADDISAQGHLLLCEVVFEEGLGGDGHADLTAMTEDG